MGGSREGQWEGAGRRRQTTWQTTEPVAPPYFKLPLCAVPHRCHTFTPRGRAWSLCTLSRCPSHLPDFHAPFPSLTEAGMTQEGGWQGTGCDETTGRRSSSAHPCQSLPPPSAHFFLHTVSLPPPLLQKSESPKKAGRKGQPVVDQGEDDGPQPMRPIRYPGRIPSSLEALLRNTDGVLEGLRRQLKEHVASGLKELRTQVCANKGGSLRGVEVIHLVKGGEAGAAPLGAAEERDCDARCLVEHHRALLRNEQNGRGRSTGVQLVRLV